MNTDKPGADAAEVAVIRNIAIPLTARGNTFDPAPILELAGSASIIGLGEPSHGDAQSMILKFAIIEAAARTRSRTLIAWERGVGNMEHIVSVLEDRGEVPPESRRWIYPWVSEEAAGVFRWLGADWRSDRSAVRLCGVDMDGLAPPAVFEALCAAYDAGDGPLAGLRDAAEKARTMPARAELLRSVIATADDVLAARYDLAPIDRLVVSCTRQWAQFRIMPLDPDAEPSAEHKDAGAFRDRCMAQNLMEQSRIHRPQTILFTAHNGHVSRDPWMAGGHLAREAASDYLAIGMAFGRGRFNAGTARPEGGFDRKLVEFEAEPPPEGTLERLLDAVGLPAFVVDLRSLRGTDHPLARQMRMREVSLAGGTAQFELIRTPAHYYDVLVWIESISPSRILRDDGSSW